MMDFLLRLEQLPFCIWLRESSSIWAFPMVLFLHTLGMSMIAGVSAVIDLAFLGLWPKMPIKPLERLYPIMWSGFWINAATGSLLTITDASTRLTNSIFYIKMTFVFAGVGFSWLCVKKCSEIQGWIRCRFLEVRKAWLGLRCFVGWVRSRLAACWRTWAPFRD